MSELTLAGDVAQRPSTHVMSFAGDHPCNKNGVEIDQIRHSAADVKIDESLTVNRSFSAKPPQGYVDYYDKVTTYVRILEGPAHAIDPNVTAKVFPLVLTDEEDSPFEYVDTASSRAQISALSAKFVGQRVGIVGVGGTGSYVLDFVAKTPVREIRLIDDDVFAQHNAFRSPRAAARDELRQRSKKVTYLKDRYSRVHRGIVAIDARVSAANVKLLEGLNFVFLCLDKGVAKAAIIAELERSNVAFVDVGMGVELVDGALLGALRVTTSTPDKREHVRKRVSLGDREGDDDYARNIQIAELNALNAALAVIKWKKYSRFYHDLEDEHNCTYSIDGNLVINGDHA